MYGRSPNTPSTTQPAGILERADSRLGDRGGARPRQGPELRPRVSLADQRSRDALLASDSAGPGHISDCYGHNLDALRDCMREVIDGEYGWTTNRTRW
ncbi:hypothetical protein Strop_2894 [Salinispora tropica CNB-440]|uniref:Barstar (barnase inhibitor) domain-containing protein n=1 Tax=Salinispora tropica (strain ATCC BAA-916 / DSM 44818 / JCM 13857 / NBRC 105044 / CNB-440) TaxID=369723 RepID=A4X8Y4_SALTO|nr:hypothetical protein Strop_2894 [Salinispora tropica CNB-440]